ncbi:zinc ribbon domain-containing protein [Streptomyces alfalfae]|uniref:Zinc ribbon domain-containing protein n=2 Tax=Streptomyces alfalfae TaxID=1642299 RepID=A0A7T4PKQ2_9ACTN|nr:zinc ribbon domain-containing protein [Streptomyces alfalfae]QUI34551.1 zinc ribbon domain-containing protein [Streptomyces alfalfae]
MSDSWMCPSCGGENQPNAAFCGYCGYKVAHAPPSGRPDSGPPPPPAGPWPDRPSAPPPRAAHVAHAAHAAPGGTRAQPSPLPGGGAMVEGQVRALTSRTERQGESDHSTVWTFRVERYDEAGDRISLIPVEMRGYRFEGAIHDGDWVRAGGRRKGGTLHVNRLENLTTGASVRAKGIPKPVMIIACVMIALIAAFIAWNFYGIVFEAPDVPSDYPSDFP